MTTTTTTTITDKLVTIEIMPEWVRSTHEAAGYSGIEGCGQYPLNGAYRCQVLAWDADEMLLEHGEWARVIE